MTSDKRQRARRKVTPLVRHPMCVAYDAFQIDSPWLFDCTTLNMHPAHHRYLAHRLREAFESGWKAAKQPLVGNSGSEKGATP